MRSRFFKYFICVLVLGNSFSGIKAQTGLCPSNLDFEQGNFSGWECRAGTTSTFPLPLTGPVPGRHTIIDATTAGTDPFGFFPEICPNGSGFSLKLGNHSTGAQAESISYTYTIPSTLTVFSMMFYYAVVLESPGHAPSNQPRFQARIIDVTTNTPIPCVDFDFIAGSTPGGFQVSPIPGNLGSQVLYKDWTPISINLNAYIGRTIMLEFITRDCSQTGHAGYAYLDVSTVCNGAISGSTICAGDTAITLVAPFGFETYAWYADNTFPNPPISTTQTLLLDPPPAVGTVFPVIVTPFTGFGCVDTLYATITVSPKPVSVAGPDASICAGAQIQIGGPGTTGYNYAWTPASQVSNPISPNPIAWIFSPGPEEFIVKTIDLLTGCFSFDTTYISTAIVDTAIRLNGKGAYCIGDPAAGILSVSNTLSAVQWYDANGPIPGATSSSYQPTVNGDYWAQVTSAGCVDSTVAIPIRIHPLPQASFTASNDTGCITNNSFLFTNTSTIADNSVLNYTWRFSDGTTQQTTDATKTFSNTGNHLVDLLTTSAFGCKDSINYSVLVVPNGTPDFTWDTVCINRPALFRNLSNENGSLSVNYSWDFGFGNTSVLKDPLPVTYTSPGTANISLQLTALGCETDPKTISKSIIIFAPVLGILHRDITVPLGSSAYIHARPNIGISYHWQPHTQLSSYYTQYTEFFANDDVKYLIDIVNQNSCVTTDTLNMLVLKKPGVYLPTAFTPNGDGLNDILTPYLIGMKSLKHFSIFNRWGNPVFNSSRYGEGWDGKYKGAEQPAGVYVYSLQFITTDDKLVSEKGTITLVR